MRVTIHSKQIHALVVILLIAHFASASTFSYSGRKYGTTYEVSVKNKGQQQKKKSSEYEFLHGFVRKVSTFRTVNLSRLHMLISSRHSFEFAMPANSGISINNIGLTQFNTRPKTYQRSVVLQQTPKRRSNPNISRNIQGYRGGQDVDKAETDSMLSSSLTAQESGDMLKLSIIGRTRDWIRRIDVQDAAVIVAYSCTQFAITVPVILIPLISAEPYEPGIVLTENSAAFAGAIASVSFIGGGMGKLINGFVCQSLGGRTSGVIYLLGLAFFSTLLSTTYTIHGYALAGMEFCASMMWTAMSVLVAERYASNPKKFTAAITSLSLASTTGTLSAKLLGGALLSQFQWRQVCLLSTVVATLGSAVLFFFRDENYADSRVNSGVVEVPKRQGPSTQSIKSSISNVLGNKMFYVFSFAHFTAFIARSCDKILGTFIVDMTDLPRYICGTLTTSVTVGFILGLVSGKKMVDIDSIGGKKAFTFKRYGNAVLSAGALALCANQGFGALLGQYGLAAVITLFSCTFAASIGFQFYQFPSKFATAFGKDRAVFISLCDGFGFFMLSPFWSSLSDIAIISKQGWITAWLIVAGFVAVGGLIMTKSLQTVLQLEDKGEKS